MKVLLLVFALLTSPTVVRGDFTDDGGDNSGITVVAGAGIFGESNEDGVTYLSAVLPAATYSETATGPSGLTASAAVSFSTTLSLGQNLSYSGSGSIDTEATGGLGGGFEISASGEAEAWSNEYFTPDQDYSITLSLVGEPGTAQLALVDMPDETNAVLLTDTGTETVELTKGVEYGIEFDAVSFAAATPDFAAGGTVETFSFSAETSVPDPSIWSMLLSGIALFGFCLRRRLEPFPVK